MDLDKFCNHLILVPHEHMNTMFKFPRLKLAIFATCCLPPQSPPGICLCTSAYLCIGMFAILLTALLQQNHLMLSWMLRMLPSTWRRLVKGWSCYLRVWDRCVLSFIAFWSSPHLLCLAQTLVPQSSSLVDMEVKRYGSRKGMEVEKGWIRNQVWSLFMLFACCHLIFFRYLVQLLHTLQVSKITWWRKARSWLVEVEVSRVGVLGGFSVFSTIATFSSLVLAIM